MKINALRTPLTYRRVAIEFLVAMVLLCAAVLLALVTGSESISVATLVDLHVWGGDTTTGIILREIRLPRIALGAAAGGALALSGVLFQALLRNPLAEPYILGVSNGSAIGAIVGFLLGWGVVGVPLASIGGGALAVTAVLAFGRESYGRSAESMLLGGVMVGAIGAAAIFLLLHLLGPQVRTAIQWMLGDLSSVTPAVGYAGAGFFALLAICAWWGGDALNALAMGEDESYALGFNVNRVRLWTFVVASVVVGLTVAFCGAIGFVGLVVPHIVRRLIGADHRGLLPIAVVTGGAFTVLCDTIARGLLPAFDPSSGELPVGAVTALVGAPLFIYLLRKS